MKMTKKLVALSAAALAFGVTGAFAQQRNTTTTTTTTTTYVEEYEETTGTAYVEETELEEVETGTYTETRTYEAYVAVPVETTKESTYTVKQGKPQTTWSTADFIDPYAFHITNVLSSDILKMRDNMLPKADDDGTKYASEFGGLYESVVIDYDAKRLKFKFAPQVALAERYGRSWVDATAEYADTEDGLNRDDLGLFWNGMRWFVQVFPFDIVSLDLHHNIYTPGANMAVADDPVTGGNLGSEGLTLVLYPNDKLRFAVTAPFDFNVVSNNADYLNAEKPDFESTVTTNKTTEEADGYYRFNFGAGFDYKFGNAFTLGLVAKNVLAGLNGMSVGLYGNITPTDKMFINIGVTLNNGPQTFDYWNYADDTQYEKGSEVAGGLLVNLAWGYNAARLEAGVDALVSFVDLGSKSLSTDYENLYIGGKLGYWFIEDTLKAGIKAFFGMDFDGTLKADKLLFGFNPNVTYKVGRSTFDAGFVLEYAIGTNKFHYVKFPVSWTYRFI